MPLEFPSFKSKMGSLTSKCKTKKHTKDHSELENNSNTVQNFEFVNGNGDSCWVDDQELKILRRTLEHNPELFVLNNLMMAVQFFENYDEEITKMRQSLVSAREMELNVRLPPQKHALIPDVLQERVAQNIDFIYVRPSQIRLVEPLQPTRIYIIFDNIEVTEQNYNSPYCSVNETMTYSMQLKASKHKGYVFLQRLEVNPSKKKNNPAFDEAIYSDGESLYSDKTNDSNLMTNRDNKSGGSGNSSLTSPSSDVNDEDSVYGEREDEYNCVRIKGQVQKKINSKKVNVRTRNPEKEQVVQANNGSASSAGSLSSGYRSGNYTIDSDNECTYGISSPYVESKTNLKNGVQVQSELPRQCFQIYDAMKKRRQRLNNKERMIKGIIHSHKYDVWYLVSSEFMEHFVEIFSGQLSKLMGFESDVQEDVEGAIIYRDKLEILETRNGTKEEQFAILPCIWCPWPDIAYEWLQRPRGNWPEYEVIEKIKEIGCHLIPEGFGNENATNNDKKFEWEMTFPAAERYLETCMTYSQVRIYLMALVLQKTFIRSDSYVGLTDSQIKNQLFWLIEENDSPAKWHDSRMGEWLLKLLNSLYRAISQDVPVMEDYFAKEKNIFQGKIYLLRTQKQLKRIIENPVLYLLHAMQNIRHSRSFFPKLNYTELLSVLTEDILTLVNPLLAESCSTKRYSKGFPEKEYDHIGFWDNAKQSTDRTNTNYRKPVTNKTLIDSRRSYDQVLEITVRCAELEPRRLCLLLDLFIRHFIQIAEYCHKYGALSQKKIYVDHAERLSILLSEHNSHKEKSRGYREALRTLKRRATGLQSQDNPPETPKRNSDHPIFTSSLNDRYQTSVESQPPSVQIIMPEQPEENALGNSKNVTKSNSTPFHPHTTMAVVHEVQSSENHDSEEKVSKHDKKPAVSFVTNEVESTSSEDTYI